MGQVWQVCSNLTFIIMATLDEILGGSPPDGGGHAPKGSQEWAEQNSGENAGGSGGSTPPKGSQEWAEQNSGGNAPVSSSPTAPTQPGAKSKPSSGAGAPASGGGGGGYEELFKKLNPYTPPTAEELEKERKREKRAQIFAAIGDGITALSNLFFTTQYAPNMYDGKNTISQANKVRYDKLIKDREEKNTAYFNGLMRARQADAEDAHRERSWQRQLGLDQEARDRYNESITHRNEREQIADDRYNSEQAYRRGRDEEADRRWQANFDEDKRRSDRSYNFQVRQHNDNVAVRREQARATAARGVRGKQLGFADGNGNQVSIYENVWKGSMQGIYDTLVADGITPTELQLVDGMSASDKEDFVKQNWYKSNNARAQMLALSKLDPATMTSEVNDEDGGLGWGNSDNRNDNETDW